MAPFATGERFRILRTEIEPWNRIKMGSTFWRVWGEVDECPAISSLWPPRGLRRAAAVKCLQNQLLYRVPIQLVNLLSFHSTCTDVL